MEPFMVEPVNVEIKTVLPCAVENLTIFALTVEAFIVDVFNVLPNVVENMIFDVVTVEPISVERKVRLHAVIVLPTDVEAPMNPA